MPSIKELREQLYKAQLEAIAERKRKAEIKAEKELIKLEKKQNKLKGGRPKLKPEILEKAMLLAEKYTLNEVAFRLDISVNSLYNHGISRNLINKRQVEKRLAELSNEQTEF